jgi:hypothetical protein
MLPREISPSRHTCTTHNTCTKNTMKNLEDVKFQELKYLKAFTTCIYLLKLFFVYFMLFFVYWCTEELSVYPHRCCLAKSLLRVPGRDLNRRGPTGIYLMAGRHGALTNELRHNPSNELHYNPSNELRHTPSNELRHTPSNELLPTR